MQKNTHPHPHPDSKKERKKMPPKYTCTHEPPYCQRFCSASLDEALEHLRLDHETHAYVDFP